MVNHIALCINKAYIIPCGTLILSIQHYIRGNIIIHILHKELLLEEQQQLLSLIAKHKNIQIIFHNVSSFLNYDLILRPTDHVTIETYFRLFLPKILSQEITKILYLDCDMICIDDINPIFQIDLSQYAVGMCYDEYHNDIRRFNRLNYPQEYGYFNAGLLLINLQYWRENNITNKLINYLLTYPERCINHDQDAINAICYKKILPIHPQYNVQHQFFYVFAWSDRKNFPLSMTETDFISSSKWKEIQEAVMQPRIIHFTWKKPWLNDQFCPFTTVWNYFFQQSPWYHKRNNKPTIIKKKIKRVINFILCLFKIKKTIDHKSKYPKECIATEEKYLIELCNSQ